MLSFVHFSVKTLTISTSIDRKVKPFSMQKERCHEETDMER